MPDEPPSQMIRVPTPLVNAFRELSRLHRAGRTKAVLEGIERLVAAIDSEFNIDIDSVTKTISMLTERLERLESGRESEEAAVDIAELMLSISDLTERLEKIESDIEASALTMTDLNLRVSDLEGVGDIGYAVTSLSELSSSADISVDSEPTAEVEEQADIIVDSGMMAEAIPPPQPKVPLTQSALAKRFNCSDKAVEKQRKHGKESFARWSVDRDPDGIVWTWEGSGGRGQPLRFVPS